MDNASAQGKKTKARERASSSSQAEFDYLFKVLVIGDSGSGKSTLVLRFTSNTFEYLSATVAGQEKFRTLTSSYYRGAHGIIMVYDVTRRETFTNLSDVWAKEIDLHSINQDQIKILVGNKVDKENDRVVSTKEGIAFAREYGCLFLECSARTGVNVAQCFDELVLKILDTPTLLGVPSASVICEQTPPKSAGHTRSCCS